MNCKKFYQGKSSERLIVKENALSIFFRITAESHYINIMQSPRNCSNRKKIPPAQIFKYHVLPAFYHSVGDAQGHNLSVCLQVSWFDL